jgi:hypothetical protein
VACVLQTDFCCIPSGLHLESTWNPPGIHRIQVKSIKVQVESTWTPYHNYQNRQYWVDSMWTPCGLHVDSMWTPCGLHVDSMWTPPGVHESMWNMWSPPGIYGGGKVHPAASQFPDESQQVTRQDCLLISISLFFAFLIVLFFILFITHSP